VDRKSKEEKKGNFSKEEIFSYSPELHSSSKVVEEKQIQLL
jgi:hypothetical protein